jgi:hypothetical protein
MKFLKGWSLPTNASCWRERVCGVPLTGGKTAGATRASNWRERVCGVLVAAYFLYFAADTVWVHFAPDDMMNMASYWRLTPWQILLSLFMPWRGFYRPIAALYYVPLHYFFGLNPAPYHAVLLLLLLIGINLTYRLAVVLGVNKPTAAMAALIVCFHSGIANLYYNTAFVYDALCGLFYLAALVYYVRIRECGRGLRGREVGWFLALTLLALDAKEMAVTLPVVLAAYEWSYHPAALPKRGRMGAWFRGPGHAIVLSGILDLAYCYGKAFGRDALMKQAAYTPVISLARWETFQARSLGELFLAWGQFQMRDVALLWFAVFYLARRLDRPVLWFCWLFVAVTPLPIEFLEGRGGACLYVPLLGWAIFAAVIFREIVNVLSRVLVGDPVLRHLGAQSICAILIVTGMFLWAAEGRRLKESYVRPSMSALGRPTWEVIQQLDSLRPQVQPHSSIVFLNDPFEGYDMAFIAQLWFRDRSLEIKLDRKTPFTREELAQADHVFTFADGRLVQVR